MPMWLSMFLSLGGSTLIALIVTLIFSKFKDGTKKAINRRKEETRDEMRLVIREETHEIKSQLNNIDDRLKIVQDGTQCSLRTAILRSYYECMNKGYKTNEDAENMDRLLETYYALGGNSFVKHTIEPEFRNLDNETEYNQKHKHKRQTLNEDCED